MAACVLMLNIDMEVNDEPTRWAAAGDSVLLTLSGIDILQVSTGSVLCARDAPIPVTTHFAAQIVVFDVKIPITVGFPVSPFSQCSSN